MDESLSTAVGVAIFAGLFLIFQWQLRKGNANKATAWRSAADKLGGKYSENPEAPSHMGFRIDAEIEGVTIWAMIVQRGSGNRRHFCTEVHATTSSQHLELALHRKGQLTPPGSGILGKIPVEIDDQQIKKTFRIRTNDLAIAKSWLEAEVLAKLAATEKCAFVIADCGVRAIFRDVEGDEDRLVGAARAVAALAKGGLDLLKTIEKVAKGVGGRTEQRSNPSALGGFEVALTLPGCTVIIDLVHQQTGVYTVRAVPWTRVRAETTSSLASFVAIHVDAPKDSIEVEGLRPFVVADAEVSRDYRLESDDPKSATSRFDAAACRLILEASPAVLANDTTEVTALLEGVDIDDSRLAANVELIVALTGGKSGPYR